MRHREVQDGWARWQAVISEKVLGVRDFEKKNTKTSDCLRHKEEANMQGVTASEAAERALDLPHLNAHHWARVSECLQVMRDDGHERTGQK